MSLNTGIASQNKIDITTLGVPTKKYVDEKLGEKVDKSGDTIAGPLSMNDGKIWDLSSGTLDTNAVNKKYVDDADNLRLTKTGGTLLGDLSMDDNKITDLATPTDNTDASTKKYVDDQISGISNLEHYYIFQFPSTSNNTWIQSRNLAGYLFFTNNRDIKLTILAHVFDDDYSLNNLNLYYWVRYWTKTRVQKDIKNSLRKTNVNEYPSVQGTQIQTFGIFEDVTIKDISCFILYFRYFFTGNIGNESIVHTLIEYV